MSANIWWIWQQGEMVWDDTSGDAEPAVEDGNGAWRAVSPDLEYIHDTLLEAMTDSRDPEL